MAHTTVPKHEPLEPDLSGTRHIVAASAEDEVVTGLLDALRSADAGPVELVVQADTQSLDAALTQRLAAAGVGVRVYAAGDESFVRFVSTVAHRCGLERDEVVASVTASRARRVYCTHCRTITSNVTTDPVGCAGCGRALAVYHHYSRRKGAYMGFMADAEAPGEIPDEETRWP